MVESSGVVLGKLEELASLKSVRLVNLCSVDASEGLVDGRGEVLLLLFLRRQVTWLGAIRDPVFRALEVMRTRLLRPSFAALLLVEK